MRQDFLANKRALFEIALWKKCGGLSLHEDQSTDHQTNEGDDPNQKRVVLEHDVGIRNFHYSSRRPRARFMILIRVRTQKIARFPVQF